MLPARAAAAHQSLARYAKAADVPPSSSSIPHDHQKQAAPGLFLVAATHCWVEFCFALWLAEVLDEPGRAAGSWCMPPSSVNVDSILPHHIVVTYVNDGGGVDSRKLFKDESCASADELVGITITSPLPAHNFATFLSLNG